jgi:hypothetical protein
VSEYDAPPCVAVALIAALLLPAEALLIVTVAVAPATDEVADDDKFSVGDVIVGDVAKTARPDPVSSVSAAANCADVATSVLLARLIVLFVSVCVASVPTIVVDASGTVSVRVVAVVMPEHWNCATFVTSVLSLIENVESSTDRDGTVTLSETPLSISTQAMAHLPNGAQLGGLLRRVRSMARHASTASLVSALANH